MLIRALRPLRASGASHTVSRKCTAAMATGTPTATTSSSTMPSPAAAIDFLMLLTNLKV